MDLIAVSGVNNDIRSESVDITSKDSKVGRVSGNFVCTVGVFTVTNRDLTSFTLAGHVLTTLLET
jgi:hypothetical protein